MEKIYLLMESTSNNLRMNKSPLNPYYKIENNQIQFNKQFLSSKSNWKRICPSSRKHKNRISNQHSGENLSDTTPPLPSLSHKSRWFLKIQSVFVGALFPKLKATAFSPNPFVFVKVFETRFRDLRNRPRWLCNVSVFWLKPPT